MLPACSSQFGIEPGPKTLPFFEEKSSGYKPDGHGGGGGHIPGDPAATERFRSGGVIQWATPLMQSVGEVSYPEGNTSFVSMLVLNQIG